MAAVGAVGALFELSELDAAAIGVAEKAYEKMSRFGFDGRAHKRPRPVFNVDNATVKNVVPGGVGHYKGDFRKRAVPVSEGVKGVAGYSQEQEVYGALSMSDVQYLTVQSVNLQMIGRALGMGIARMLMWKHFKQTYTSATDYLFPNSVGATNVPQLIQVTFFIKTKISDGSETIVPVVLFPSPGITGTTTLDDFAGYIHNMVINPGFVQPGFYTGDATQFHAYQFSYGAGITSVVNQCNSPRYSFDEQEVRLSVLQVINLQNTTRADSATAVGGVRDAIDANPLHGRVYHMHGIYPDVESQANASLDATNFAKRLQKFVNVPHQWGIGVPDINPTGEWRSLPRPQVFANIVSCQSGLRLEPGEIKKEVLKFSFRGAFNDLMRGLSYLATSASIGSSDNQPIYASDKLGTCKLFAFEKVVPTGLDTIELNYHIDRYINCIFPEKWKVLSARGEFSSFKFDLKQGPQVLAANPAPPPDPQDVDVELP